MKATLYKEEFILKDEKRVKEYVHTWFDENDNIKFTVRFLNGHITSIQNHLSKWLTKDEIKEFEKMYYNS